MARQPTPVQAARALRKLEKARDLIRAAAPALDYHGQEWAGRVRGALVSECMPALVRRMLEEK